jgi:hypothetical protein
LTPTYVSWLNLVERFFGLLTQEPFDVDRTPAFRRFVQPSLPTSTPTTKSRSPFKWTKTADQILDKMRRFGLRTQQAHGDLFQGTTDPGD